MAEPTKSPFDLLLDQVRTVVREEIAKALAAQKPPKLLFTTKEVSAMLGIPESWLASKARAGQIPHRKLERYRMFTMADIESILEKSAAKNGAGDRAHVAASTDK
jgi:hypothetical protein